MEEIPNPDRLHRGIALSKILIGLNIGVMGVVISNCVLLFQAFFPIQGNYRLAVEAFEGRVWIAYGLTWIGVALMAIDIAITIFRHEYFHSGTFSIRSLRNPTDTTLRNLIYHGIAASLNLGLLIGWIAYFAHGTGLFHGEIHYDTLTITPAEYLAYFIINGIFVIAIIILTFFLIFTRWITNRGFQQQLLPHTIPPSPEPPVQEPSPSVTIIDEMRVSPVGTLPPSEAPYIPIEERKAQKLEELRLRRENVYEAEKEKMLRELEEKKKALLAEKREAQESKMRRSKQYQKIKQDIILKMEQKAQEQKPAEKPAGKKRDEFDFT